MESSERATGSGRARSVGLTNGSQRPASSRASAMFSWLKRSLRPSRAWCVREISLAKRSAPRGYLSARSRDGTATPLSFNYSPDSTSASLGRLSIPAGMHTVSVDAEVPCWYCSGGSYRAQASASVCVRNAGQANIPGKSTISKADGNAWIFKPENDAIGFGRREYRNQHGALAVHRQSVFPGRPHRTHRNKRNKKGSPVKSSRDGSPLDCTLTSWAATEDRSMFF